MRRVTRVTKSKGLQKVTETSPKYPPKIKENPNKDGPVFLKANQKTGDIHIRIEYGLGEGILLSCQQEEEKKNTSTFGPFPLNFF